MTDDREWDRAYTEAGIMPTPEYVEKHGGEKLGTHQKIGDDDLVLKTAEIMLAGVNAPEGDINTTARQIVEMIRSEDAISDSVVIPVDPKEQVLHDMGEAFLMNSERPSILKHTLRAIYSALVATATPLRDTSGGHRSFQHRVNEWMLKCFGSEIAADRTERNHRFLEEALELVQSLDCTASEAHQLVDYVFGRPVGEPDQEAGGVNVTFAALCTAAGLDMRNTGEAELARISHPETIKKIRTKQAAKPDHSPLPGPTALTDEEWHRRAAAHYCKRLNLAEGSCDDLVRTLVEDGDFIRDYADDPEGAVDEELSNWND
ncbi:hypothetical protein FHS78_000667 [Parvibaculum indicum]|uniref:hypothetical protein n=1 Tax=Parvibaculum indicum TaxID=562969 RepID=UPI0019638F01|nr:hypothetical protein [Parvibaculum indicum]NIJ40397.1 hypothetical protein [Parvibaculum indicum]